MFGRFPHHKPETFLGTLCARGHDHEGTGKSLRYVSHPNCVVCAVEARRARDETRRAAKEAARHIPPPGHYQCCACKADKPVSEFVKSRENTNGRCKSCRKAYYKTYHERRPDIKEKSRQRSKARHQERWIETLWRGSRFGAVSRGLERTITLADCEAQWNLQGGRCYWTGMLLEPDARPRFPLKPSLDRLDPTRGYVPGNIVFTSLLINLGRQNCTEVEFHDVIARLRAALRGPA